MRRYKKSQIYSLKGKSFIQYFQEEKKEATLEVAVGKETMSDILGKTKISRTSLYNWKNNLVLAELEDKINDKKSNRSNETDKLKEEIEKLKKDIYRLTMGKYIRKGIKVSELLKKKWALILKSG